MGGVFGGEEAKLKRQYDQLAEQAYKLSQTNRQASDLKQAEADEVLKKLEALEREGK